MDITICNYIYNYNNNIYNQRQKNRKQKNINWNVCNSNSDIYNK